MIIRALTSSSTERIQCLLSVDWLESGLAQSMLTCHSVCLDRTVGSALEMLACMSRGSWELWVERVWDGEVSQGSTSGMSSLVGPCGDPWRERGGSQPLECEFTYNYSGAWPNKTQREKERSLPDASAQNIKWVLYSEAWREPSRA